jgi:hypothetical protein
VSEVYPDILYQHFCHRGGKNRRHAALSVAPLAEAPTTARKATGVPPNNPPPQGRRVSPLGAEAVLVAAMDSRRVPFWDANGTTTASRLAGLKIFYGFCGQAVVTSEFTGV